MKTKAFLFTGLFVSISFLISAQAQNDNRTRMEQLARYDSADVNALAAYPENNRKTCFEISSHPEGIVRLNDIQKHSNEQFKTILSSYSKEEQQKIWNLTRYQGLTGQLVAGGKKNSSETETILKDYPKEIHDDAVNYSTNHFELLENIEKVNTQFNSSFENIIREYSPETQSAFREIIRTPEVITILNNNMHMTVQLGDLYKRNPEMVMNYFSELNLELAQQKAKDLAEWKETISKDPDAKKELKQSAEEYAKENGYAENDYRNVNPVVVEHYVYMPYPYWCGYPWWHAEPYWYPYPHWYHWGFYYWQDDFVWIGPPSWFFLHWHFSHHTNFYHYPHITNSYLHYYHGPRRAVVSNTVVVHSWVRDNRNNLPHGFLKDDAQRPDRIKEYGQFQVNYDEHIRNNPKAPVNRNDFLQQHANEYPHLQPATSQPIKTRNITPSNTQPGKNNETPRPMNPSPIKNPGTRPTEQPRENPQIRTPKENQPTPRSNMHQQPKPSREIRQNPQRQPEPKQESRPRKKDQLDK
ncbi:MAG: hypothetical protein NT126_10370 [Bacteroidetes bacterium]|nr:hypothetical protein [Bacteroidota bacterium]